jgi:transketolase
VPTLFDDAYRLEWGKAATLREGTDVAIVATGMMTAKALDAAAILAGDGIAARVIHMPSIKPLDVSAVVAASMEIGKIVTVENHSVIGGLGGAVAEALTEHAPCFLKRLGLPDVFGESGDDEAIFCKFGCNTAEIATAAREMAKGR